MQTNNHSSNLILIAAVECQTYDKRGNIKLNENSKTNTGTAKSLHKVKIYQRDSLDDLSSGGGSCTCTGKALYQAIVKKSSEIMDMDEYRGSSHRLEIYNYKSCQFETIYDVDDKMDSIIDCHDIVSYYGNRVRCILYHQRDYSSDTNMNDKSSQLQIMGRYFRYDSNGMDFAGTKLIVKEKINNKVDGTGLNVWDGALLLALYLEKSHMVESKSVLELGAGTGFCGIAASLLGANRVILTDLEYTLDLMNDNISRNQPSYQEVGGFNYNNISSHVCDWFDPPSITEFQFDEGYPDIILVADCIWIAELVDPLMKTLDKYCNEGTIVLISYQQRGKETHDKFWYQLRHLFVSIRIIDTDDLFGLSKPDSLSLIECKKLGTCI